MKINAIQPQVNSLKLAEKQAMKSPVNNSFATKYANYTSSNIQANFMPLSFKGNASNIKNAFLITREEEDVPLLETKMNGSYVVDFDSQTEIIYGKNAIKFLNKDDEFPYDTQVIIPKKCEGTLKIDGKKIPLAENSALMINEGTKAKVSIKRGYPMVVLSKKDYDWYERYSKDCQNEGIRGKFLELLHHNTRNYNGEFSPNLLLPEKIQNDQYLQGLGINKYEVKNDLISVLNSRLDSMSEEDREAFIERRNLIDKLHETGLIESSVDGYIKFKALYNKNYQEKIMKEKGFSEEEINTVMPIFEQIKAFHADARYARVGNAEAISPELLEKLKEKGIFHNNKKRTEEFFWKNFYENEQELRNKLSETGFTNEEQDRVVQIWHEQNKAGFDITGLKFIDNNVAIYSLDGKVNNWTWDKTHWATNSLALVSKDGQTPFIGASLVQTDEPKVFSMKELNKDEKLHKHPSLEDRRQTEVYVVTSGAAALTIVKDGKPEIKIIKEGELAVIDPGVEHCVNSIIGEYEHVVVQVPSAFQYGFGFKCISEEPEGYNEEVFSREAKQTLEETRTSGLFRRQ